MQQRGGGQLATASLPFLELNLFLSKSESYFD